MRKAILVSGILAFLLCTIFLSKSFYYETKSKVITNSGPKLQIVSLPVLPKDNNISVLTVVNKSKAFAVLSPKPDIVSFDVDQNTFRVSNVFQRDRWQLSDLNFVDLSNGFAVGGYGTILKTTDGGVTWNQLPQFSEYDFHQVIFLNQSVGYVAGKLGIRNKKTNEDEWKIEIFKTNDGGHSWTKSYHSDNENTVFQIAVFSSEIALASINAQRLIRTEDGGQNWKDISYSGKEVTSITFAPDNTGWLVGGKGEFLKSEDAGITWQKPNNFPPGLNNSEWLSIDFDDKGNGLAVSEQGVVVYTDDSGKTWKKLSQKVDDHLRFVSIKDGTGIILGSDNIYTFNF